MLELSELFPKTDEGFDMAYNQFLDAIDVLENVAEAIDFTIDVKKRHLPHYKMTKEEAAEFDNNEDLFWSLIDKGLEAHPDLIEDWGEEVIMERIEREVGVIKLGGAIDYFLITWDIINWCHRNGIMTGISRGSAGGCLVSYLLGITKLDPMRYDLLFERFLNAGRVGYWKNETIVTLTLSNGEIKEVDSEKELPIWRNGKKLHVKAGELEINDDIICY